MGKVIDLTGMRFGKLVVVNRAEDYIQPSGKHHARWRCKCDCGNETDVTGANLKNGSIKSCGCYRKERLYECNRKTNEYKIMDNYIVAKTGNGVEFYVDKDDEWVFDGYCWGLDSRGYMRSREHNGGKTLSLHRLIMNCPDNMIVDHINGDTLDNRKSNLRIVTQSQNSMNKQIYSNNTSGITGVSFDKENNKWAVRISVNYKCLRVGRFDSFEDAVAARREAEERCFGEHSYHNSRVACSN